MLALTAMATSVFFALFQIMEVFKESWPECVNLRMSATQCKEFIDEEILTTFVRFFFVPQ